MVAVRRIFCDEAASASQWFIIAFYGLIVTSITGRHTGRQTAGLYSIQDPDGFVCMAS
jgi:hypothetical protein